MHTFFYKTVFHISAHSATRMWRERIDPTCVSSAPYAQLIRGRNTTSAGSVGGSGKVGPLGRIAATTTTASTRTLQLLQTCPTISLPDVKGVTSCPSVRACPTCGMRVEHNQQAAARTFTALDARWSSASSA